MLSFVLLLCVLHPESSFAWRAWGSVELETAGISQSDARVVNDTKAFGGLALRGSTGRISVRLLADTDRDALARHIAVRVKSEPCGSLYPLIHVSVDGRHVRDMAIGSQAWQYKTSPLPSDMVDASDFLGREHTWEFEFEHRVSATGCVPKAYLDIAGWRAIGTALSSEMSVRNSAGSSLPTGQTTWYRRAVRNAPSGSSDALRLVGGSTATAATRGGLDFGTAVNVTALVPWLCGEAPIIEVSTGGKVIGRRVLDGPIGWFRGYAFPLPAGVVATDVAVRFVNPGRTSTCTRVMDLDWAFGSADR
jgi:hypothetical protein